MGSSSRLDISVKNEGMLVFRQKQCCRFSRPHLVPKIIFELLPVNCAIKMQTMTSNLLQVWI